ncbi:MAG TPA: ATP-binding cassette domain-containing protein [Burkholderiaceae bacterium]|nr:ATP-binding cassette domain-containing protein [Burkholderiaceae bacterium]
MTVPSSIAAAAPLLRLENIHKSFRMPDGQTLRVLHDVSLKVNAGDVLGLVGKSGAGKSTLLRMINLLERPDSGNVIVAGRTLTTLNKKQLREARQSIGMIFQQFNLLQNATVFDNVAFPLRIHGGRGASEIAERVRECLSVVGLTDKASSYPAQLSGGQKQRVAIARALAPRPSLLLCDEPTSALDAETTRTVLDTLQEINQRFGVTIVIVTHELDVARRLCREVAVLEDGVLMERFAVNERNVARRTALGRELSRLVAIDDATTEPPPAHRAWA